VKWSDLELEEARIILGEKNDKIFIYTHPLLMSGDDK